MSVCKSFMLVRRLFILAGLGSLAAVGTGALKVGDGCCCGASPAASSAPLAAAGSEQPEAAAGDPYPLDTCPVSGGKLGSMGDPVVKKYDGREVRFCCGGCVKKFEADKQKHWKAIDEKIIEAQMPFYPLQTCPIGGGELGSMGEPVNHIHNNRLVRFCCKGCLPKFNKDSKPTLKELDEAVIRQQGEHYPLQTCLVSGEALGGDMGGPVERVYGNHLVRLCCKGCIKGFEKSPAKYLTALDDAWRAQGGLPAERAQAAAPGEKSQGHEGHGAGDDR